MLIECHCGDIKGMDAPKTKIIENGWVKIYELVISTMFMT